MKMGDWGITRGSRGEKLRYQRGPTAQVYESVDAGAPLVGDELPLLTWWYWKLGSRPM